MRLRFLAPIASLLVIAFVASGCVTLGNEPLVVTEEEQPAPVQPPEPGDPQPEPEPEREQVAEEQVQPEIEDDVPQVSAPIAVPEELYSRAFSEVEAVIAELNQVISRREFEIWKTYLTRRYVEYYSHPDVLAEISRQPFLVQSNIRLTSLQDYFVDVVVPSRARARLDDLIFYSDSIVEAVTEFRGQRVILYLLRKVDGQWRIDTLEVPPPNS